VPKEAVPKEYFNLDNMEGFEKQIVNIIEIVKKTMATPTTIFGWFQTHLNLSLESSNCLGAAKLQHNEKCLKDLKQGKHIPIG
jgi:hypothetical protein